MLFASFYGQFHFSEVTIPESERVSWAEFALTTVESTHTANMHTTSNVGLEKETNTPTAPRTVLKGAKTALYLMGFASIKIGANGWSSAGVIPAIEMAVADVNARDDLLADYELFVDMKDTEVSDDGYGNRFIYGADISMQYPSLSSVKLRVLFTWLIPDKGLRLGGFSTIINRRNCSAMVHSYQIWYHTNAEYKKCIIFSQIRRL